MYPGTNLQICNAIKAIHIRHCGGQITHIGWHKVNKFNSGAQARICIHDAFEADGLVLIILIIIHSLGV